MRTPRSDSFATPHALLLDLVTVTLRRLVALRSVYWLFVCSFRCDSATPFPQLIYALRTHCVTRTFTVVTPAAVRVYSWLFVRFAFFHTTYADCAFWITFTVYAVTFAFTHVCLRLITIFWLWLDCSLRILFVCCRLRLVTLRYYTFRLFTTFLVGCPLPLRVCGSAFAVDSHTPRLPIWFFSHVYFTHCTFCRLRLIWCVWFAARSLHAQFSSFTRYVYVCVCSFTFTRCRLHSAGWFCTVTHACRLHHVCVHTFTFVTVRLDYHLFVVRLPVATRLRCGYAFTFVRLPDFGYVDYVDLHTTTAPRLRCAFDLVTLLHLQFTAFPFAVYRLPPDYTTRSWFFRYAPALILHTNGLHVRLLDYPFDWVLRVWFPTFTHHRFYCCWLFCVYPGYWFDFTFHVCVPGLFHFCRLPAFGLFPGRFTFVLITFVILLPVPFPFHALPVGCLRLRLLLIPRWLRFRSAVLFVTVDSFWFTGCVCCYFGYVLLRCVLLRFCAHGLHWFLRLLILILRTLLLRFGRWLRFCTPLPRFCVWFYVDTAVVTAVWFDYVLFRLRWLPLRFPRYRFAYVAVTHVWLLHVYDCTRVWFAFDSFPLHTTTPRVPPACVVTAHPFVRCTRYHTVGLHPVTFTAHCAPFCYSACVPSSVPTAGLRFTFNGCYGYCDYVWPLGWFYRLVVTTHVPQLICVTDWVGLVALTAFARLLTPRLRLVAFPHCWFLLLRFCCDFAHGALDYITPVAFPVGFYRAVVVTFYRLVVSRLLQLVLPVSWFTGWFTPLLAVPDLLFLRRCYVWLFVVHTVLVVTHPGCYVWLITYPHAFALCVHVFRFFGWLRSRLITRLLIHTFARLPRVPIHVCCTRTPHVYCTLFRLLWLHTLPLVYALLRWFVCALPFAVTVTLRCYVVYVSRYTASGFCYVYHALLTLITSYLITGSLIYACTFHYTITRLLRVLFIWLRFTFITDHFTVTFVLRLRLRLDFALLLVLVWFYAFDFRTFTHAFTVLQLRLPVCYRIPILHFTHHTRCAFTRLVYAFTRLTVTVYPVTHSRWLRRCAFTLLVVGLDSPFVPLLLMPVWLPFRTPHHLVYVDYDAIVTVTGCVDSPFYRFSLRTALRYVPGCVCCSRCTFAFALHALRCLRCVWLFTQLLRIRLVTHCSVVTRLVDFAYGCLRLLPDSTGSPGYFILLHCTRLRLVVAFARFGAVTFTRTPHALHRAVAFPRDFDWFCTLFHAFTHTVPFVHFHTARSPLLRLRLQRLLPFTHVFTATRVYVVLLHRFRTPTFAFGLRSTGFRWLRCDSIRLHFPVTFSWLFQLVTGLVIVCTRSFRYGLLILRYGWFAHTRWFHVRVYAHRLPARWFVFWLVPTFCYALVTFSRLLLFLPWRLFGYTFAFCVALRCVTPRLRLRLRSGLPVRWLHTYRLLVRVVQLRFRFGCGAIHILRVRVYTRCPVAIDFVTALRPHRLPWLFPFDWLFTFTFSLLRAVAVALRYTRCRYYAFYRTRLRICLPCDLRYVYALHFGCDFTFCWLFASWFYVAVRYTRWLRYAFSLITQLLQLVYALCVSLHSWFGLLPHRAALRWCVCVCSTQFCRTLRFAFTLLLFTFPRFVTPLVDWLHTFYRLIPRLGCCLRTRWLRCRSICALPFYAFCYWFRSRLRCRSSHTRVCVWLCTLRWIRFVILPFAFVYAHAFAYGSFWFHLPRVRFPTTVAFYDSLLRPTFLLVVYVAFAFCVPDFELRFGFRLLPLHRVTLVHYRWCYHRTTHSCSATPARLRLRCAFDCVDFVVHVLDFGLLVCFVCAFARPFTLFCTLFVAFTAQLRLPRLLRFVCVDWLRYPILRLLFVTRFYVTRCFIPVLLFTLLLIRWFCYVAFTFVVTVTFVDSDLRLLPVVVCWLLVITLLVGYFALVVILLFVYVIATLRWLRIAFYVCTVLRCYVLPYPFARLHAVHGYSPVTTHGYGYALLVITFPLRLLFYFLLRYVGSVLRFAVYCHGLRLRLHFTLRLRFRWFVYRLVRFAHCRILHVCGAHVPSFARLFCYILRALRLRLRSLLRLRYVLPLLIGYRCWFTRGWFAFTVCGWLIAGLLVHLRTRCLRLFYVGYYACALLRFGYYTPRYHARALFAVLRVFSRFTFYRPHTPDPYRCRSRRFVCSTVTLVARSLRVAFTFTFCSARSLIGYATLPHTPLCYCSSFGYRLVAFQLRTVWLVTLRYIWFGCVRFAFVYSYVCVVTRWITLQLRWLLRFRFRTHTVRLDFTFSPVYRCCTFTPPLPRYVCCYPDYTYVVTLRFLHGWLLFCWLVYALFYYVALPVTLFWFDCTFAVVDWLDSLFCWLHAPVTQLIVDWLLHVTTARLRVGYVCAFTRWLRLLYRLTPVCRLVVARTGLRVLDSVTTRFCVFLVLRLYVRLLVTFPRTAAFPAFALRLLVWLDFCCYVCRFAFARYYVWLFALVVTHRSRVAFACFTLICYTVCCVTATIPHRLPFYTVTVCVTRWLHPVPRVPRILLLRTFCVVVNGFTLPLVRALRSLPAHYVTLHILPVQFWFAFSLRFGFVHHCRAFTTRLRVLRLLLRCTLLRFAHHAFAAFTVTVCCYVTVTCVTRFCRFARFTFCVCSSFARSWILRSRYPLRSFCCVTFTHVCFGYRSRFVDSLDSALRCTRSRFFPVGAFPVTLLVCWPLFTFVTPRVCVRFTVDLIGYLRLRYYTALIVVYRLIRLLRLFAFLLISLRCGRCVPRFPVYVAFSRFPIFTFVHFPVGGWIGVYRTLVTFTLPVTLWFCRFTCYVLHAVIRFVYSCSGYLTFLRSVLPLRSSWFATLLPLHFRFILIHFAFYVRYV